MIAGCVGITILLWFALETVADVRQLRRYMICRRYAVGIVKPLLAELLTLGSDVEIPMDWLYTAFASLRPRQWKKWSDDDERHCVYMQRAVLALLESHELGVSGRIACYTTFSLSRGGAEKLLLGDVRQALIHELTALVLSWDKVRAHRNAGRYAHATLPAKQRGETTIHHA